MQFSLPAAADWPWTASLHLTNVDLDRQLRASSPWWAQNE